MMEERVERIRNTPLPRRTEDDRLILFMWMQLEQSHKSQRRLAAAVAERVEVSGDILRDRDELSVQYNAIIHILRVFGYTGPPYASDISLWLYEVFQVLRPLDLVERSEDD